ncbi:MAG TPA: hypothetical protein PKV80_00370 [Leptospiraceae bacterium]|nr:hypothetical protein [Leptospiraceae bacterium]HNF22889.1 hypothetical protein [Leptospiraceae bacterium]HNO21446.1 hypothetical protein [Leptospiraceae bacterium]
MHLNTMEKFSSELKTKNSSGISLRVLQSAMSAGEYDESYHL